MIGLAWIYGLGQAVLLVLILVLGWRFFDRRYRGSGSDRRRNGQRPGSEWLSGDVERTNEVFTDPADGRTYRVYYNRRTGEREYVEEPPS